MVAFIAFVHIGTAPAESSNLAEKIRAIASDAICLRGAHVPIAEFAHGGSTNCEYAVHAPRWLMFLCEEGRWCIVC